MDIIFQSGDFYNETSAWTQYLGSIITLIGVAISGLFGVYLFNKGIKKDREFAQSQRELDYKHNEELERRRYEKEMAQNNAERAERLESFGQLFSTLLLNSIENAIKQTKLYKDFIAEFEKDLLGQHVPTRITQENLKRILQLDLQLILDFFIAKGLENKEFINTISHLDYLNAVFNSISNNLLRVSCESVESLTNSLIQVRMKMLTLMTEYINNQKRDNHEYGNDPVYWIVNDIIENYYKDFDGVPRVSWDYEKLIIVSKEIFIQEPYRFIPFCNQLLNLAKNGGDIVFSIRQFNSETCNRLNKNIEQIEKSIETLRENDTKIK